MLEEQTIGNIPPSKRVALSGAAARNVEFFITNNDVESGEDAWERWQCAFSHRFSGRLQRAAADQAYRIAKRPDAAAKLAESFANAEPLSPYAPQLLDRASKLLASANPTKSQALRQLLKQKYPEDPLAQN